MNDIEDNEQGNDNNSSTLKVELLSAGQKFDDVSPQNIMRHDLTQLVNQIFEEEYDPIRVKKLSQAREARKDFSWASNNLNVSTGCPVRIFEALNSYLVQFSPPQPASPYALEDVVTPRIVTEQHNLPQSVVKSKLLQAIHETEDIFVAYAEDTIDRAVTAFRLQ